MWERIDKWLPAGPQWFGKEVTLPEAPNETQFLFYRDPVECLRFLAQNPSFDQHQSYSPVKYFTDRACNERVYSEMHTGDAWHFYQSVINDGETVNPAIIASDATHVTNFSGDGKVHPAYITSGQIHSAIRAQPSRRAFLLLAYIPVCKFSKTEFPNPTQQKAMAGRLQHRLFHACMRIILKSLKEAGENAVPMIDSHGNMRMTRVFLAAWISDKEEQNMIAALGANSCTNCLAETRDLGDAQTCQVRTGKSILEKIRRVRVQNPDATTWKFIQEARDVQLSGVEEPFWSDLPHTDICKVICHDVLHGLHKGFSDHTAKWSIQRIGDFEIDNCFRRLPKTPGFRSFPSGISKISQWSGREWKDLERYFLPVIYGAQRNGAIIATRAELDFIYHAQWKTLSDADIQQMIDFNDKYHAHKDAFLGQGGRELDHFQIPKLHA